MVSCYKTGLGIRQKLVLLGNTLLCHFGFKYLFLHKVLRFNLFLNFVIILAVYVFNLMPVFFFFNLEHFRNEAEFNIFESDALIK